jgi:L,D-transpeptidase-like protein
MIRPPALASALTLIALALAPTAAAAGTPPRSAPRASAELSLSGAFSVQRQPVTVIRRSVTVTGVVRPYVAGQSVRLRARVGGRTLLERAVSIRRSPGGTYGWFRAQVMSPRAGQVEVSAGHARTATLGAFRVGTGYAALGDGAGPGARGRLVVLVQQRLAALHIFTPQSGVYDGGTELALDAYHRLLHRGHSTALDRSTLVWMLNGWGTFPVRYPRDGRHVEGNLGLQLLALIDRGQVQAVYPISSGKPSTPTILGRFRVYRQTPGYLPDGMYYSSFFSGGYAVHGYNPAPDYPASHGCMRVPIPDAIPIYHWLRVGDGVDVYP